jgi:hypothetical protein
VTTIVDPRSVADFDAALHDRVPGYLPGWAPSPGGAGSAVLSIAARLSAVVADRLNHAPEKNELAFLDMLGVSLLPAQAARAPVTFTPRPGIGDSRAAAGSQVGATVPGVNGPLIFETERDIALAAAPLVEVATVLPGTDQWASHTGDYTSRRPFTLFGGPQSIGHELYLAHDVHFALQGQCEVQVTLELATTAGQPIATVWEYWDGGGWRPFNPFPTTSPSDSDSVDGTKGLTRSGTVVLRVEGAGAQKRVVNWIESYWIRARCSEALTPDYAGRLPTLDRILVASVVAPPIGALMLFSEVRGISMIEESELGKQWSAKSPLVVDASGILPLSPDPSSASVAIKQTDATDPKSAHNDTRSLNGGHAKLDNIPDGNYEFQITIAGFTTATASVQVSSTGSNLVSTVVVGYRLNDRRPDNGTADRLPLDLTKPFHPFGASALAGAACYLMLSDALSKPTAKVTMVFEGADTGLENDSTGTDLPLEVDAQYFDGEQWQPLDPIQLLDPSVTKDPSKVFSLGASVQAGLQFAAPSDCAPTSVNGVNGYWMRFRIASGAFGKARTVKLANQTSFTITELISPVVKVVRYAYYYRSPREVPTACHSCNDFTWVDHSASVATRGTPFPPFTLVSDPTPALYFGFDGPLPEDVLSIYLDVEEVAGEESGPALVWECLDEGTWVPMSVGDETNAIALPGVVRITYPGITELPTQRGVQLTPDTVRPTDLGKTIRLQAGDLVSVGDDTGSELAVIASIDNGVITFTKPTAKAYPRATVTKAGPALFGTPRAAWIRARLRNDGDPLVRTVDGIYPNTAWAANLQTRSNELLGTSDGNPGQSVAFSYAPVLAGEQIDLLELTGPRASVDLADLTDDVIAHGGSADDLTIVHDPATGAVTQVWVRWAPQRNLYFSQPTDRHYTIERSSGLVVFGDDRHGRIPPIAPDGIRATLYRSGGGRVGNVAAGTISQLLSGVPAASVTNIRAAEGGADTENAADVLRRGPASVAARAQAITATDYETLAREASPAVAVARAVPATDPTGRTGPGFVQLIVMPDSTDPQPVPSFGLRRQVEQYIAQRCPASMAGQVYVFGPEYQPVGVFAEIVPADPDAAGVVIDAVTTATSQFLHPLTGGPDGSGWAFGRDVYLSDLARVIGGVSGVDHVRILELLLDGTPHGQVVQVPPGRIVVAGELTIRLAGGD